MSNTLVSDLTIPTCNNPEQEAFGKHCGKKEKMLITSSFSFYQNFSILSNTEIVNAARFNLSSKMLFVSLEQAKVLSFSKELKIYLVLKRNISTDINITDSICSSVSFSVPPQKKHFAAYFVQLDVSTAN